MNPQASDISSPTPAASIGPPPSPTRAAVPLPSLKPGETITWIKLDRPRFALGEILSSSFTIVGVAVVIAVSIGLLLGHLRSKRRAGTHGAGGLGLR